MILRRYKYTSLLALLLVVAVGFTLWRVDSCHDSGGTFEKIGFGKRAGWSCVHD